MTDVSPRRLALEVFLFFLLLYLLTANGRIVSGDGEAMFQVTRSIAERGWFDVPAESVFEESIGPRGADGDTLSFTTETAKKSGDGRLYAKYGLGQSLASVPLYYAGELLSSLLPQLSSYFATRFAVAMLNPIVSALSCAVLFGYAFSLGYSLRTSLVVSLIYGAATMAWPHAKTYNSEPLSGLALLVACFSIIRSRFARRPWLWMALAGSALGLAVMVRISTAVLLPIIGMYWLAIVRKSAFGYGSPSTLDPPPSTLDSRAGLAIEASAFVIPIAAFLALVGWYNFIRFGSPTTTGYQTMAWNQPLFDGLYGLLLSPGKGAVWYNPALILSAVGSAAFYRWRRREALLIAGLGLVWIVFHSPYGHWEGGWTWGPRFILPILPFFLIPIGVLGRRASVLTRIGARFLPVAIALGLVVQMLGVGVDYTRYLWSNYSNDPDRAYQRVVYEIGGSPLVGHWVELAAVVSNVVRPGELEDSRRSIDLRERERIVSGLTEAKASVAVWSETQVVGLNFPDFWFIYLYLFGAPTIVVASAGLALWIAAGAMLVILDRRLRQLQPEGRLVSLR